MAQISVTPRRDRVLARGRFQALVGTTTSLMLYADVAAHTDRPAAGLLRRPTHGLGHADRPTNYRPAVTSAITRPGRGLNCSMTLDCRTWSSCVRDRMLMARLPVKTAPGTWAGKAMNITCSATCPLERHRDRRPGVLRQRYRADRHQHRRQQHRPRRYQRDEVRAGRSMLCRPSCRRCP